MDTSFSTIEPVFPLLYVFMNCVKQFTITHAVFPFCTFTEQVKQNRQFECHGDSHWFPYLPTPNPLFLFHLTLFSPHLLSFRCSRLLHVGPCLTFWFKAVDLSIVVPLLSLPLPLFFSHFLFLPYALSLHSF